jgi:hypothetical protein
LDSWTSQKQRVVAFYHSSKACCECSPWGSSVVKARQGARRCCGDGPPLAVRRRRRRSSLLRLRSARRCRRRLSEVSFFPPPPLFSFLGFSSTGLRREGRRQHWPPPRARRPCLSTASYINNAHDTSRNSGHRLARPLPAPALDACQ